MFLLLLLPILTTAIRFYYVDLHSRDGLRGRIRKFEGYIGSDEGEWNSASFRFKASSAYLNAGEDGCVCLTARDGPGVAATEEIRCWVGPHRLERIWLNGEVVKVTVLSAGNQACFTGAVAEEEEEGDDDAVVEAGGSTNINSSAPSSGSSCAMALTLTTVSTVLSHRIF